MNLGKAVDFVKQSGNEVELARLDYLLTGKRPSQEVVDKFFTGQRSDGGWAPFWAGDYSSVDATCFRLAQAEQLGIGKAEMAVERAVHFLAQRQTANGSWQEDEKVSDLAPPWAKPGDLTATLYLTANCALWLALLSNDRDKALGAAGYLYRHLDESGKLPGYLQTHWLAAALWQKLAWQEAAERVSAYLGGKLTDLAASDLSWLITTLCATGVEADHPLLEVAAALLEPAQQSDGRWASEDGPGQDVHVTLEALRALRLCA